MHYHAEVLVSSLDNIKEKVSQLMQPFQEEYNEENDTLTGFWDWWQIGGRWTGAHGGYNPEEDENNIELCTICNGTGLRNDRLGIKARTAEPSYTCNGCGEYDIETRQWKDSKYGKGKRLVWSTEFVDHESNIIRIKDIADNLTCYTLLTDKEVFHQRIWTGKDFSTTDFDGNVKKKLDELGITDGYLVTVDYHC